MGLFQAISARRKRIAQGLRRWLAFAARSKHSPKELVALQLDIRRYERKVRG